LLKYHQCVKIAHISDIHIRSLSRHSEYKRVFTDLLEEFKSLRVDHVFIGGDIFHTKLSGISPEYIDLMYWWLTEMAKLVKVHMILGNHDGLLTNLSRQDAVSPIVNAINNPNIFLYKLVEYMNLHPDLIGVFLVFLM
jgi:DNA repair exonuclease